MTDKTNGASDGDELDPMQFKNDTDEESYEDWYTRAKDQLFEMACNVDNKLDSVEVSLKKYIDRKSSLYDFDFDQEIRKLRPDWFTDKWFTIGGDNNNKKKLLEMAKNKEDKPFCRNQYGMALFHYVSKTSGAYDEDFDKEIRKLAPNWFTNSAIVNKQQLLKMAECGDDKPDCESLLGKAFLNYTSNTAAQDHNFIERIRKLAPDWLVNKTVDWYKNELLEMAKRGENKPNWRGYFYEILFSYVSKKSDSYDEDFDKEIRKLAPDWFTNNSIENKHKLLEMAKNNENKPSDKKHPLNKTLYNYINKSSSSYDEEFDNKIRKLRPDWFISTAADKKKKLLEIAKNNDNKPVQNKHPLGIPLKDYTNKTSSSYDEEFNNEIRKIRPDWFINTAVDKKKKLLEMAKSNEDRPNCKKTPLGKALINYMSENHNCYDEDFDKEIRKLRPDWFIKQQR